MDYQSLYLKTVVELRRLAKETGVRIPAGTAKAVMIDLLLEAANKSDHGADEKADLPEAKETKADAAPDAPEKTGDAQETEAMPPMRMAANPQVIDRRMPTQPRDDRENAPTQGYAANEGRSRPEYAAGTMWEDRYRPARQPDIRTPEGRYDRRQEGQQARPGFRQEQYPAQRGESAFHQGRYNARQESFEGRNGGQYARSANVRQEGAFDGRNRYCRQDAAEGGPICGQEAGQDARRRNAPRDHRDWNPAETEAEGGRAHRREGYYNEEYRTSNPAVPEMLAAGECSEGSGILEIQPDGYGFLRAENYRQGSRDVYVSIAQIRRFGLRMGDHVVGQTRPQREGDRYTAMMYITRVNGKTPEEMIGRRRFEELIPIYPDERLKLEKAGENDLSLRMIDMLAPIGKGQRGLIVSPPKAGKTTLLKKLANAITDAHPEIHLIVLLIDERPEEVTDMKRSIRGEVVYSTFDETPENHTQVAETVLERAQRLVELGQDVVILMDSITRLARAYNLVIPPTGRSLSGGLDPGALHKPKRFFGAARNIENGGSLTVIATALVDTGSRMDDIIYEEFKGTGNMEMHLDRKLSDRRVFPAVDMVRSGTRREELLLTEAELEGACRVRRMLGTGNDPADVEKIIGLIEKTGSNAEFFQRLSAYQSVYEKSGYSMSREITK